MGEQKTTVETIGGKVGEVLDKGKRLVEDRVEEVKLNHLQDELLTKKLAELEEKQKTTLDPMVAKLNTVDLNKKLSEQNELKNVLVDILPAFMLEMCIRAKMKGDSENGKLVSDLSGLLNQIEAVYPQATRSVSDQVVIEFLKKMQTNASTTLGLSFVEQFGMSKQGAEEMYGGVMAELEQMKNNEGGSAEVGEAKDREEAPVVDGKKDEDNSMIGWMKENPGKTVAMMGVSGLALGYGGYRLWKWAFSDEQEVVTSQSLPESERSNWGILRSIVKVGGVSAVAAFLFGKVLGAEFVKDYAAKDLTEEAWAQVLIDFSEGRFLEAIFCMAKGANPNRERYIDLAKSWNVDSLVFRGLEDRTVEELVAGNRLKESMLDLWPLKYFDGYVNDEHKIRAQLVNLAEIYPNKKRMKLGEFLRDKDVLSSIRKGDLNDKLALNPKDELSGAVAYTKIRHANVTEAYRKQHETMEKVASTGTLNEEVKNNFEIHVDLLEEKLNLIEKANVNISDEFLSEVLESMISSNEKEVKPEDLVAAKNDLKKHFANINNIEKSKVIEFLRQQIGVLRQTFHGENALPTDGRPLNDDQKKHWENVLDLKADLFDYLVDKPAAQQVVRLETRKADEEDKREWGTGNEKADFVIEKVVDGYEAIRPVGTGIAVVTGMGMVYNLGAEYLENGELNLWYLPSTIAVGYGFKNVLFPGVGHGKWEGGIGNKISQALGRYLAGYWKANLLPLKLAWKLKNLPINFALARLGRAPIGMSPFDAFVQDKIGITDLELYAKGRFWANAKGNEKAFGQVTYNDVIRILATDGFVDHSDQKTLATIFDNVFGRINNESGFSTKVLKYKTSSGKMGTKVLDNLKKEAELMRWLLVNQDSSLTKTLFNSGALDVSRNLDVLDGFLTLYQGLNSDRQLLLLKLFNRGDLAKVFATDPGQFLKFWQEINSKQGNIVAEIEQRIIPSKKVESFNLGRNTFVDDKIDDLAELRRTFRLDGYDAGLKELAGKSDEVFKLVSQNGDYFKIETNAKALVAFYNQFGGDGAIVALRKVDGVSFSGPENFSELVVKYYDNARIAKSLGVDEGLLFTWPELKKVLAQYEHILKNHPRKDAIIDALRGMDVADWKFMLEDANFAKLLKTRGERFFDAFPRLARLCRWTRSINRAKVGKVFTGGLSVFGVLFSYYEGVNAYIDAGKLNDQKGNVNTGVNAAVQQKESYGLTNLLGGTVDLGTFGATVWGTGQYAVGGAVLPAMVVLGFTTEMQRITSDESVLWARNKKGWNESYSENDKSQFYTDLAKLDEDVRANYEDMAPQATAGILNYALEPLDWAPIRWMFKTSPFAIAAMVANWDSDIYYVGDFNLSEDRKMAQIATRREAWEGVLDKVIVDENESVKRSAIIYLRFKTADNFDVNPSTFGKLLYESLDFANMILQARKLAKSVPGAATSEIKIGEKSIKLVNLESEMLEMLNKHNFDNFDEAINSYRKESLTQSLVITLPEPSDRSKEQSMFNALVQDRIKFTTETFKASVGHLLDEESADGAKYFVLKAYDNKVNSLINEKFDRIAAMSAQDNYPVSFAQAILELVDGIEKLSTNVRQALLDAEDSGDRFTTLDDISIEEYQNVVNNFLL